MLTKWIDRDMSSMLPGYASHYVGVGGLVLNKSKEKVLLITEKRAVDKSWKMPGGLVENGETID